MTMRAHAPTRVAIAQLLLGAVSLLAVFCPRASALDPSLELSQYTHTAWTAREGLKGSIRSIVQTPDGYLWLGTEFGLVRFDGVRFMPWSPPPGQALPISDILALLAAHDGTLWIGTLGGLASWSKDKLVQYPEIGGDAFALLEDHKGTVWVGGSGKLCAIQGGKVECNGTGGSPGTGVYNLAGNRGVGVLSLYEDPDDRLWAGTESGLWLWQPGPQQYLQQPIIAEQAVVQGEDARSITVATGNVLQEVKGDGKAEQYDLPGVKPFIPFKLLRDRNGALWIGTFSGLLRVYHGKATHFGLDEGLSGDLVTALFEDREGTIWVGTTNGLDRFREPVISSITARQGLSTPAWSTLAARDGSVWIGSADGLNRWFQGQMTVYRSAAQSVTRSGRDVNSGAREVLDSGLADNRIGSLFEDEGGRIWVTSHDGVAWFENGKFTRVKGVPVGSANAIVGDKHEGVWISYPGHGLFHVVETRVVESVPWPWSNVGRDSRLTSIAPDPIDGGMWVGFLGGGIAYFKDGQVRKNLTSKDGLGSDEVWNLYVDRDGTLWAATQGGASRVKDGRVRTLTVHNGLPCDGVHWVMEDDTSSLWLYTACGLVHVSRAEQNAWVADPKRAIHATVFDGSDGVRMHALINGYGPGVTKSTDGRLWFADLDGVSLIDPHNLRFNKVPPPVHVEQITADGRTYDPTPGLRLPALIRNLSINFTALSLVAPEKIRFRFKLEGQDEDWREVANVRQVEYSNLAPGKYRFRVTACNNSGVWNEEGAILDFSVAPAYYQTNWFRALCGLMFLAILWIIYQLRVGAFKRRQALLERHQWEVRALNEQLIGAQEAERMRIAGELHDGILQQITSLTLRLGKVRRQVPADSEAKAMVSGLQQQLIQMGTDVRHLSHELHPSLLQEAGLPAALSAYCEEFSKVRGLTVSCETDESVKELSPAIALCIYRIAQEALGNAAKYSAAKKVEVRLSRSDGRVCLSVSDDGVGCDANQIRKSGGLGVINMRERVLPLNGTFEFNSEPGHGATVKVGIPFQPAS